MTAAIAGIFAMADGSVAQPVNLARGYELNAIAAAVVGGCSLQGGVGTVTGTILGALFLRLVIDAVAKLIKAGADVYEGMIVGIVVVLAVTLTQFRQLVQSGGEFFPGARGCAGDSHAGRRRRPAGHDGQRQRRAAQRPHADRSALAVGLVALIVLAAVKLLESQRAAASRRELTQPRMTCDHSPIISIRSRHQALSRRVGAGGCVARRACRASCTPSAAKTARARAR